MWFDNHQAHSPTLAVVLTISDLMIPKTGKRKVSNVSKILLFTVELLMHTDR